MSPKIRVNALLETPNTKLCITNRLLPVPGECGEWREKITVKADGSKIELSGSYPRSCGEQELKTGSLNGVRALAGYLLDRRGQRWLLVAMVNHPNAAQAKEGLDRHWWSG